MRNTVIPGICRLDPNTGIGDATPAYTYALNLAEVEVDTRTGKTRVIRFTCVDKVGKVGNIDAVNGQAYGGITHSIGFALTENYDDVKKHTNIASSGVPYIKDIPDDITVIHLETTVRMGPSAPPGLPKPSNPPGTLRFLMPSTTPAGCVSTICPPPRIRSKPGWRSSPRAERSPRRRNTSSVPISTTNSKTSTPTRWQKKEVT